MGPAHITVYRNDNHVISDRDIPLYGEPRDHWDDRVTGFGVSELEALRYAMDLAQGQGWIITPEDVRGAEEAMSTDLEWEEDDDEDELVPIALMLRISGE